MYYRLLPEEPKDRNIHSLKWALAKKLGEYDGSMGQDLGVVDSSIVPFLEGIAAVGNEDVSEDAQVLIDAIAKYGKIQLLIY